jgi:hypothetical protein
VTHRWAAVLPAPLLLVGFLTGAVRAPITAPTTSARPATVWFLTNEDRVGRIGPSAKTPVIYDNPLHCAVNEDDCNLRGIAAANGSLWLPDSNNGLRRIDPTTGRAANGINDDRYSSDPVPWNGGLWFTDIDRVLAVEPPATNVAKRAAVPNADAEALAPSPHYLWIAGSGSTRNAPAAVARVDPNGRLAGRFELPISGEVAPTIAALDDRTAYVTVTPDSSPPPPARLFELTVGPTGRTAVKDLGMLSYGPGGIAALGGHVWITDVNTPRIVELDRSGGQIGEIHLDSPADGQLVGTSGRLWCVGTANDGQSELEVSDPRNGAIASITPIRLPGTDQVGPFTVTDLPTGSRNG